MEKNRNREAGNDGTKFPFLPKKKKTTKQNKILKKSKFKEVDL